MTEITTASFPSAGGQFSPEYPNYDGSLEIDNNWVENAIRPKGLGRKNYLFAGSHEGAKRVTIFYSLFGTCKKNNVNPYQWLKKALEIIPDYPAKKLNDLLPQNLKL